MRKDYMPTVRAKVDIDRSWAAAVADWRVDREQRQRAAAAMLAAAQQNRQEPRK